MNRITSQSRDDSRWRPGTPTSSGGRLASSWKLAWADDSGRPAGLDGLLDEFTDRWRRGETPRAEDYLDRIDPSDPAVVELVYHEYCLAESSGFDPDPSEYLRRFPEQSDRLGRIFGLRSLVGSESGFGPIEAAAFPESGDEIGPYHLLRELGRGAFARVFLAEQGDLGDRLVVLKVSTRASAEPRLLARARHPHIVEVLLSASTGDGGLHLLALPFSGGAPLSAVLAAVRRRPKSGHALLEALDLASAPEYLAPGSGRPARDLIAALPYPKAVAWILARLAEALDHAHRCGVAHGDIKPSNVLITADGQPMLLDFNLAVDWRPTEAEGPAIEAGGTLAYMPPERLRALADPDSAPLPRAADRRRADLYGLGLVLREVLTGHPPEVPERRGNARAVASALAGARSRPWPHGARIPADLRPILDRCLAPDPLDRYARGADLAADLDRYRLDLPPAFARSAPGAPALARWSRRRRRALAAGVLVMASASGAAFAFASAHRGTLRDQAVSKLESLWSGREPGVYRFRSPNDWSTDLGLDRAESAFRFLDQYAVLDPEDWRLRDDVKALPEADRADLESWIWEQGWRYAHVLESRPDSPADWQRALGCAERCAALGAPVAIRDQVASLRGKLGRPALAAQTAPAGVDGWVEDYLLGVASEALKPDEALRHYQDALVARPSAFWARYRAATVAFRLGKYDEAATHLSLCAERRPRSAEIRDGLATCFYYANRVEDALAAYGQALALDPESPAIHRNRAFVHARLGRTDGLAEDLGRIAALTRSRRVSRPLWLWSDDSEPGRFAPWAADDVVPGRSIQGIGPDEAALKMVYVQGLIDRGSCETALAELDTLLEDVPENLLAQYRHAMLSVRLSRPDAGRELWALQDHPRLGELLVREPTAVRLFSHTSKALRMDGRLDDAVEVALRGLGHARRLGSLEHEAYYVAARAFAYAARADPSLGAAAMEHLRQAQDRWPGLVDATSADPLFEGLDVADVGHSVR